MHVNHRQEHDIEDDDDYDSYCSTRVSTVVEDIESGANALHEFGDVFFWDVRLGKDHGAISLMSLELGMMPCLEKKLSYCILDVTWRF
jgi:hypothetical protein